MNIAKKSLEKNDLSLALMSLDESYKLVVDAQESAEAIIITTPETKDEEIKEGDKKEETKIPTPEKQESETPLADPTSP